MRVAMRHFGREADLPQHGGDGGVARGAGHFGMVDFQALGDDLAHGHARVEAGIRVLEHQLGAGALVAQALPV